METARPRAAGYGGAAARRLQHRLRRSRSTLRDQV